MAIRKLFSTLLVFGMACVLVPQSAFAASEVVCPPHEGDFSNEPVILDTDTEKLSRIHNRQTRTVAEKACEGCGNGIFEPPGEQCDTGGVSATCDADCTAVVCGDFIVNAAAGEQCDDGNETSGDGCSEICESEFVVGCGNGILEAGEQCDDANTDNTDFCTNACTNAVCGDTVTCPTCGEQCDTGGESVTCDADCTAVACGDGNVNSTAGEQCDGGIGCENDCTAKFGQCNTSGDCGTICLNCDTSICVPVVAGTVCDVGMVCTGEDDQCVPG